MALIHLKLAKISSKIAAVAKGSTNKDEGYKFRSVYDIYNSLQPLFKAEGVFIVPNVLESAESIVNTSKGRAFRVKLKVEWTISCEDGSTLKSVMLGEGIDASDKSSNKAMTASLKYLLIYMFLIPTVVYDTDADFNTVSISPFEEEPKTLLAMLESKGKTRNDLLEIGKSLNINTEKELSAEEKKILFEYVRKL